jgi:hypothetical protein
VTDCYNELICDFNINTCNDINADIIAYIYGTPNMDYHFNENIYELLVVLNSILYTNFSVFCLFGTFKKSAEN